MIAASLGDFLLVGFGALVTAGLGAVAYFFKQWANGLSDDVKAVGDKVETLDGRVDDQTNAIGQLQVAVGWPPHLRIGSGRR